MPSRLATSNRMATTLFLPAKNGAHSRFNTLTLMFLFCSIAPSSPFKVVIVSEPAVAIEQPNVEEEVAEAIALCDGDPIAALRTTLIANVFLEAELERLVSAVSAGFERGRVRKAPRTRRESMVLRGAKPEER